MGRPVAVDMTQWMRGIVKDIESLKGRTLNRSSILPAGAMFDFAGSTAPDGWALCDGSAISRTDYPTLFAVIGTVYGVGDGSTTFNLPDFRGRVAVGQDTTQTEFDTLGEPGGAKSVTLTAAQSGSPAHTHPRVLGGGNASYGLGLSGAGTATLAAPIGGASTTYSSAFTVAANVAADASAAHTNLQPYRVALKIIFLG